MISLRHFLCFALHAVLHILWLILPTLLRVSLILSTAVSFFFTLILSVLTSVSRSVFPVMDAVAFLLLQCPLTQMIKPSSYTFTEAVSLFSVRHAAHRSSLCGRGSLKAATIHLLLFFASAQSVQHPAVIFVSLVIRTFIISHTSRCVWCSPPSQTSKSFIPSLMSIRKDWSASASSTRS